MIVVFKEKSTKKELKQVTVDAALFSTYSVVWIEHKRYAVIRTDFDTDSMQTIVWLTKIK